MGDGTRLAKTIQTVIKGKSMTANFIMGTVVSVNPLKVKVGNLTLSEDFLMLSPFCIETKIDLNHTHELTGSTQSTNLGSHLHSVTINSSNYATSYTELGSHSHGVELESTNGLGIIMLWRGLRVGDNVLMLEGNGSQKYYILQRQEGLIN